MKVKEDKKQGTLWKAVIINIIVFVGLQMLFQPVFETNDDQYMANIAEGFYQGYNSHLVYINIIVGKILKLLYRLCGSVKWYLVLQYFLIFISFCCITWFVLKKFKRNPGAFLVLLLLPLGAYESYIVLQFTRTAALASAAGYLMMFENLRDKNNWGILGGILLTLFGSLYRFEAFLLVSFFMSQLGIYELVFVIRRKQWQVWPRYLYSFLVLLLLAFGSRAVDRIVYDSDVAWKQYKEFNDLRAQFIDYGIVDWESDPEAYEAIGISENDLKVYSRWTFTDFENLDESRLEEIIKVQEANKEKKTFTDGIVTSAKVLVKTPVGWMYTAIMIAAVFSSLKKNWVYILNSVLAVLVISMYLYYKGRLGQERVIYGIGISAIVFLLYRMYFRRDIAEKNRLWYSIAAVSGCIIMLWGNWAHIRPQLRCVYDYQRKAELSRFLREIGQDNENLYMLNTSDNLFLASSLIGEISPAGGADNIAESGGWLVHSPLTETVWEKWGIENPLKELAERKDFYLVDINDAEEKLQYIKEHFYPEAQMYLIKNVYGIPIYKIMGEPGEIIQENLRVDQSICSDMTYQISDETLLLSGRISKEGSNSFAKIACMRVCKGEEIIGDYYLVQKTDNNTDREEYRFDYFEQIINVRGWESGEYQIQIAVDYGDGVQYEAGELSFFIK